MYYRQKPDVPEPSLMPEEIPNRGTHTNPNAGEMSTQSIELGAPLNSLGLIPSQGNRAGGGRQIDTGARVGIIRNLEFTAGGRAHRLRTGTHSLSRPSFDPKSEKLITSTASDSGEPSVGRAAGHDEQPPMPPGVSGAGQKNDTSTGEVGPARRRDKKTP